VAAYIIRRLLLIVPTLFAIMLLNFLIVQIVPGGPIERILAQLDHTAISATVRISGGGGELAGASGSTSGGSQTYRGAQGLPEDFIKDLERQFGFDKPLHERFLLMMRSFAVFDFGKSYYRDRSVTELVLDKLPVSISLGLWTTLLVYLISIPLGISKAIRDGSRFDIATSTVVVIGNAVPSFLFAIFLIVVFSGGQYLDWFPLRGLHSDGWRELSLFGQATDYFWHIALPVFSLVIGGFASLTILTKNSFLDEIGKQYVVTARAKGLNEKRVLYGHVFRNAMLIVIAGFPSAFIRILFTGALLIEVIFSLDGLGLLGFEAAINRDYPVMFATLYFFTLLGLLMGLVTDLTYAFVDPRIDFEARES
jgi:microcin C transport system permease protein